MTTITQAQIDGLQNQIDNIINGITSLQGNLNLNGNHVLNIGLPFVSGSVKIDDNLSSNRGGNSFFIRTINTADVTEPTYSFLSNQSTGMWLNVNGNLNFSVNGTTTLSLEYSGDINVNQNKITNLAAPENDADAVNKEFIDNLQTEKVLGISRDFDFRSSVNTAKQIYAVPTGKSHIITKIIINVTSYNVDNLSTDPGISIGVNHDDYNDILDYGNVGLGGSTGSADKSIILYPDQASSTPNTGAGVFVKLTYPAGGFNSFTGNIYIMGIEV